MGKKLISILMALATLFCNLPVRGDNPPAKKEILIKKLDKSDKIRSVLELYAFYDGMSSAIHTTTSDLGQIEMTVVNLSTGEAWSDTFDSSLFMQNVLPISGSPGCYGIEYIAESGNVYVGEFIIE